MRIFKFENIDSTNNFLKDLKDKENYDLAIAKSQTLGRGRRGNKWHSENGGAYFSFILKEDKNISLEEYSKLSLFVGYSLLKTFEQLEPNLNFMFKWTNDIFVNDRKLSGILIEKTGDNFVIGIGINLNNKINLELEKIAISLKNITEKTYEINELIYQILKNFKKDLGFYLSGNFDIILRKLNSKNYLYNKKIIVELNKENKIEGVAKQIEKTGELQIEIDGKIKRFNVGEIHILKKDLQKS